MTSRPGISGRIRDDPPLATWSRLGNFSS
jgi:hypothetical protein